jgi:hypothetical protein
VFAVQLGSGWRSGRGGDAVVSVVGLDGHRVAQLLRLSRALQTLQVLTFMVTSPVLYCML